MMRYIKIDKVNTKYYTPDMAFEVLAKDMGEQELLNEIWWNLDSDIKTELMDTLSGNMKYSNNVVFDDLELYEQEISGEITAYEVLWYESKDCKGDALTQEFEDLTDALSFYNEHCNDEDKFNFWVTARNEDWEVVEDIIM